MWQVHVDEGGRLAHPEVDAVEGIGKHPFQPDIPGDLRQMLERRHVRHQRIVVQHHPPRQGVAQPGSVSFVGDRDPAARTGDAGHFGDRARSVTELVEAEWDKTLATNLTSVFHGVRAACKHFGEGSRIVNTSSLAAQDPFPGSGHYSAAKAGVLMLTKTLAHELGPKTRVNAILPGFVPTDTVKKALDMTDEDFIGFEDTLGLPAGRLGTPQDIGALTLYLCAPASEWVTGQCIRIAGKP